MNEIKISPCEARSYDADFYAWTMDQAAELRRSKPANLDWENIAEEIESLGRSDKRAISSDLKVVLEHLLKWRYQAQKRTLSWQQSIDEHRDRISDLVRESPSLATFPAQVLAEQYRRARRAALQATGLPAGLIPETCPFTLAEILDPDFWPDEQPR